VTTLFIYTVFISLFIGALWQPILGVLGYLCVYILYNPYMWWGATFQQYLPRPSVVAVCFLIIGMFLNTSKLNWSISRREVELYAFLGLAWITSFFFGVGIEDYNWQYLIKLTKIFIFIFILIRIVASLNHYKLVVWTLIFAGIFLAYQAHTLSSSAFYIEGRLDSLGGADFCEANGFAAFMAAGMTFLGVYMLRVSLWKKVVCTLGMVLLLDAIILTRSRAIFLGFLMAMPYVLFKPPSQHRKKIYVFVALGVALFFLLADIKFFDRMETIGSNAEHIAENGNYGQKETLTRVDFWKASVLMFKDHPLGVGVKNFEKMVSYYDSRNPNMDAHNTYVLCYSEIGIQGIALFVVIIGTALLQLRRIRLAVMNTPHENDIAPHVFSMMIILIIYLLGYMTTHSILYMEMLWILLSMPICLENATQKLLESKNETTLNHEEATS
jgi:putative inorganic carbon (HCO3(-)) transporter